MEQADIERLQKIKDKYAKLGWMPREDILWLLESLSRSREQEGQKQPTTTDLLKFI